MIYYAKCTHCNRIIKIGETCFSLNNNIYCGDCCVPVNTQEELNEFYMSLHSCTQETQESTSAQLN